MLLIDAGAAGKDRSGDETGKAPAPAPMEMKQNERPLEPGLPITFTGGLP
ncbi:MAG: hypothetical protein GX883_03575 [Firmicutes bacterium]|nr:hypothetical protein [Bacillota bacterium]